MSNVLAVAKNEFSLQAGSPLVLVFCVLVLVYTLTSVAGYSASLSQDGSNPSNNLVTAVGGFSGESLLFAFLMMCVGILSVADERQSGSFRVLLTKPLYRKDVITGKFIGISTFLFLIIVLAFTLFASSMMAVYVGQVSVIYLVLCMVSLTFLMFLNCCFTLGIVMCLGLLFSKSEAIIISIAFIAFEWLANVGTLPYGLGSFQLIDPRYLYYYTLGSESVQLFNTSISFGSWFNSVLPYIVLMVAESVIIVLVCCMLFDREEA